MVSVWNIKPIITREIGSIYSSVLTRNEMLVRIK